MQIKLIFIQMVEHQASYLKRPKVIQKWPIIMIHKTLKYIKCPLLSENLPAHWNTYGQNWWLWIDSMDVWQNKLQVFSVSSTEGTWCLCKKKKEKKKASLFKFSLACPLQDILCNWNAALDIWQTLMVMSFGIIYSLTFNWEAPNPLWLATIVLQKE